MVYAVFMYVHVRRRGLAVLVSGGRTSRAGKEPGDFGFAFDSGYSLMELEIYFRGVHLLLRISSD